MISNFYTQSWLPIPKLFFPISSYKSVSLAMFNNGLALLISSSIHTLSKEAHDNELTPDKLLVQTATQVLGYPHKK